MLGVGSRIGVYEITATLGRGGLGEVFRSRDTRLNSVAIKVLPESFASGPERLARFEREAQVLASLNHTNIAHIDGIADGNALVMELIEGEDLAARIARGPLPVDNWAAIAVQVTHALEAAHNRGIVHRDHLKPRKYQAATR
jgi:serine/threonine protein kinase